MDVNDEASIKALIDDTVMEFGKLDILANHTAIDTKIADIPTKVWDSVFRSDLRSVFPACKYAIPLQKNGGAIVNTGSTAAVLGNHSQGAYSSAKGGIENLTRNIAYQYGKDNICCKCIRPGLIITPQNEKNVPPYLTDIFIKETEVNRHGCPRELIPPFSWFLTRLDVTFQIINVDGGMWSHAPQNTGMKEVVSRPSQKG